jgi:hypothetical protein
MTNVMRPCSSLGLALVEYSLGAACLSRRTRYSTPSLGSRAQSTTSGSAKSGHLPRFPNGRSHDDYTRNAAL